MPDDPAPITATRFLFPLESVVTGGRSGTRGGGHKALRMRRARKSGSAAAENTQNTIAHNMLLNNL